MRCGYLVQHMNFVMIMQRLHSSKLLKQHILYIVYIIWLQPYLGQPNNTNARSSVIHNEKHAVRRMKYAVYVAA